MKKLKFIIPLLFISLALFSQTSVKKARVESIVEVSEDLGLSTTSDDIISQVLNNKESLTASSTPDAEYIYKGTVTLSGGAATLDLTALIDTKGDTISTTGKKVRVLKAEPTSTNTSAIVLSEGASNGYELAGDAWSVSLTADDHFLIYKDDNAPDVGAAAKTIDFAGSGTESIVVIIIFG